MESDWRTDEPEVGTVALVRHLEETQSFAVCVMADDGGKIWDFGTVMCEVEQANGWRPITTPEERRLRAEVERLEGKLLILRNSIINAPIVLNTSGMIHRWSDDLVKMLDKKTEAGGAG